jgi:adenosine kinase
VAVLVSGSVAVDHIMVFQGRFKDVILPDRVHALNVAFHVPELRRTFGGCAANIAYNLRLLGDDPLVLATVGGADFDEYAAWLDRCGIRRDWIRPLAGESTAGAYITTDLDDNQIIGFHPGAMDRAHEIRVEDVAAPFELGIVAESARRADGDRPRPGAPDPLARGPRRDDRRRLRVRRERLRVVSDRRAERAPR